MSDSAVDKKAQAANALRSDVLTLRLLPGADLDEIQLCARFGLSRTPLREVFRDLAGEGYFSHRANRGVRVTGLSHTTLRGFFQAAPMIYAAVLQLAAEAATPEQIAGLKEAQERFRATLRAGSVADRALANNRFHVITGDMAHNVYLLPSFKRLLIDHARIAMTFYRPQSDQGAANLTLASSQHDQIIAAIEAGDGAVAGQLALDHWQLSRGEIERFVIPGGLQAELGNLTQGASA